MNSTSSSSDSDSPTDRSLKKRKRLPDTWKQNQRKYARLHGQEYVNTAGKSVPKKTVEPFE